MTSALRKFPRLTLARTGLVLVSVPLTFELIFVATLFFLLDHARYEHERELHAKTVLVRQMALERCVYDIVGIIVRYKLTVLGSDVVVSENQQDTSTQRFDTTMVEANKELLALKDSAGSNHQERELIRRACILADQILNVGSEAKQAFESKKSFHLSQAMELPRKAHRTLLYLSAAMQEMADFENEVAQTSPLETKQVESQINLALAAGILLNVLIAIAAALFFSKRIARRVNHVAQNNIRFALGQKLEPPLQGDDEIADLDQVFHDMAATISEAARKERTIVEYARDVICTIDHSGRFQIINPACENAWKYKRDDLIGRRLIDIVVEEDSEKVLSIIEQITAGGTISDFEIRMKSGIGTTIDVLWSMHWSSVERLIFGVAHDITERKEVDRLKQEVFRMVSHDLRSPLCAVQGSLKLLAKGAMGALAEPAQLAVERAERNTVRLVALVNDLLDLEKLQSGYDQMIVDTVSLAIILEQSIEAIEQLAEESKVELSCQGTLLTVFADRSRMVQVMVNLLSNAIKFAPRDSEVKVSVIELDGLAEVRVSDEGPGVPAEFQSTIFEPFRQIKLAEAQEQKGTGLGLPICKSILEQQGGTIGVDSKLGHGSTFWFRIPLANAQNLLFHLE